MKKIVAILTAFLLLFSGFSLADTSTPFEKDMEKMFADTKSHYNINYADLGIYVYDINSKESWGYNSEKTRYDSKSKVTDAGFKAASVIKFHQSMAVAEILKDDNKTLESYYTDPVSKEKFQVKTKMNLALKNSSNIAFNNLLRVFGRERINKKLSELGLAHTKMYAELGTDDPHWSVKRNLSVYGTTKGGRINPEETGILLLKLYSNYLNNEPSAKFIVNSLCANVHSNRIPQGIGYKSPVAHKTGTFPGADKVYSDAGIVFLKGHPYIIVLLTENQNSQSKTEQFEREFSSKVYKYMAGKQ